MAASASVRTVRGSSAKGCLLRGSSLLHCRREVDPGRAIPGPRRRAYIIHADEHRGCGFAERCLRRRSAELGELWTALTEALGGSSRAVLVTGEPGIGKTALTIRVAGEAEARGVPVSWDRGESKGAPAFRPGSRSYASSSSGRSPPIASDSSAPRRPCIG